MNSCFLVDKQRKTFKINNKLFLKNHRKIFDKNICFLSG